jgi:hypothetical protein
MMVRAGLTNFGLGAGKLTSIYNHIIAWVNNLLVVLVGVEFNQKIL